VVVPDAGSAGADPNANGGGGANPGGGNSNPAPPVVSAQS
jgi:hypothetical protein